MLSGSSRSLQTGGREEQAIARCPGSAEPEVEVSVGRSEMMEEEQETQPGGEGRLPRGAGS